MAQLSDPQPCPPIRRDRHIFAITETYVFYNFQYFFRGLLTRFSFPGMQVSTTGTTTKASAEVTWQPWAQSSNRSRTWLPTPWGTGPGQLPEAATADSAAMGNAHLSAQQDRGQRDRKLLSVRCVASLITGRCICKETSKGVISLGISLSFPRLI